MGNRRIEIFEVRNILVRISLGDSGRNLFLGYFILSAKSSALRCVYLLSI